ncbi:NAD(P)/FAD-dependent oxidoreductase [Aquabacter sp. CN5-332]|uniref:flavin monoamine oxidase family protein n=1 Tax=Aquabacter sp. CN5-332 TaxID=3156608 RepID=UPI0032B33874
MPGECDVAVIGAGAAGLSAGRALREAGASFVVLEASSRTGGRAFTDTTTFGQPWDLGCHWLHSADVNPFVAIADQLGFTYRKDYTRLVRNLWRGGRWAAAEEADAAYAAVNRGFDEVEAAGADGRDVAASEVLSDAGQWNALVRHWLALMTASSPQHVSTKDFAAYAGTEYNWPVLDGYGALVRAYGADVPVTLDCPVSRIDWSGPRLRLVTPKGDVSACAVIVTVSTAVIADGRLAFTPALPADLGEAFSSLTLGVAEKVAIGFDRDVFGYSERTGVSVYEASRTPVNFQILPGPRPVAVGHTAGDAAKAMLEEGDEAMADVVLSALTDAFGADIRQHVTAVRATNWAGDPFIGGGYSCALPGKAHVRARLLEPLANRIFFAGEAVSAHDFSTCHGAHLSGLAAARRSLALLDQAA